MIAFDPHTTALVLIDLQKGILGRTLAPTLADELVARGPRGDDAAYLSADRSSDRWSSRD